MVRGLNQQVAYAQSQGILDSTPLFKPCSLVPDTNNFGLKSKSR